MREMVPENKKVSPFFIFYVLSTMQIGVGILSFQRVIASSAGYDAWISVIMSGVLNVIVIWMIYKAAQVAGGGVVSIHQFIVGKKAGKWFSSLFILYYCLHVITVMRSYIEVVQVWMFPELRTFWLSLSIFLLAIYIVYGGFRIIAGVSFISILFLILVMPLFLLILPNAEFSNLLPLLDHSLKELLSGLFYMSPTITGYEVLIVVYPFLNKPEESQKWAIWSIIFTTLIYLYLTVLAFSYFSEEQIQKNIWPTLTMWKFIQLPFVERFEYIGIAIWLLVVLPNICLGLWSASRLGKLIFGGKQRKLVWMFGFLCLAVVNLLMTREHIDIFSSYIGKISFFLNFVYIPLLFLFTIFMKRVRKQ